MNKAPRKSHAFQVPKWYLIPALVIYVGIVVYPSLAGIYYSFTDWDGGSNAKWIGWANFIRLMHDQQAVGALENTIALTIVLVIVQTILGLILAIALNANIKSRNVLRTLFFIPVMLPPLIIGVLWGYLYTPQGTVDSVLRLLKLSSLDQSWLGNPDVALWAVVAVIVWSNVGISMVIFLAGLQRIPSEYYEAASIDGASQWRSFWSITRPLLGAATTIVMTLTLVTGLKVFDQIFVMTGGGPGYATETLSLTIYQQAFQLGQFSYSTTIAFVLTILVAFLAFIQVSITRRFEVEV